MAFRRKKCCEISQHFFLIRWLLTIPFDIACCDGVVGQYNEPLDHISELSDIATPLLLRQHCNSLRFNTFYRYSILSADTLQEVIYEDCNIAFSLAQRWHFNQDYADAMIQIFAKISFANLLFEIFIRCSDYTHIDFDIAVAAHTRDFALL